jgi:hypothetical protein
MSDQSQTSDVLANATQALVMKQANERIDGLKKQIRILWIAVAIVGVIAVVAAGFTLAGRVFGLRSGQFGGRAGTFNGQQLNNGGTGTQPTTGQ